MVAEVMYPAIVAVTDMQTVMEYGIMRMPALVVNETLVSMGKVLKTDTAASQKCLNFLPDSLCSEFFSQIL